MSPVSTAEQFLTPVVEIDGISLRFSGALGADQAFEALATLLTFATFESRGAELLDEVYDGRFSQGHCARLDEDAWFGEAAAVYRDFLCAIAEADPATLVSLCLWLDARFFDCHKGFEELRRDIVTAVTRQHRVADRFLQGAPARTLHDDVAPARPDRIGRILRRRVPASAGARARQREEWRKLEEAESSRFDQLAAEVEERLAERLQNRGADAGPH